MSFRIGIDARALTGRYTGDRTYWLNLIRAHLAALERGEESETELLLYSRLPIPDGTLPPIKHARIRVVPAPNDRIWTLMTFPRALKQDRADVAHTQYTTPLRSPCPVVTTVHDISFRLHPEWFPKKDRILLNLSVPGAMRRSARVITDSESSRADMEREYRPGSKLRAILLAAGPEFAPVPGETACERVRSKYNLESDFVLAVSVLQPRKNQGMLLEAFALARKSVPDMRLAITGKKGWGADALEGAFARLGIREAVTFTDYVPDEDLPHLYSACMAMAHPAHYEGFGLTPLEAMACGAPTLVSDAPCMPEVAGEGAWVLPVNDPAAWADAIVRLHKDRGLRESWSARGLERARAFDWDRTSRETREVYREAVAG